MTTFHAIHPATGTPGEPSYSAATPAQVDAAARAAANAFRAGLPRDLRTALLEAAADQIAGLGDGLLTLAAEETGLAATPRLAGERDRTVFQLRTFAGVVREGSWVEATIDHGDPARKPLPKPDVRRMLRPVGPVAVFGASNFPLAYSVAGGDTASALAAGCPVVVKGHPAHPGTGEMVARAVQRACEKAGAPAGTFAFLHAGGDRDLAVGQELVTHPAIQAVGFTGSPAGGMALVRLANGRPQPIPVFAEMGSVNPVVVLPSADDPTLGEKLAASAMMSGGQMCTCPGLVFAVKGPHLDALAAGMQAAFAKAAPVVMLSSRVREGYVKKLHETSHARGLETLAGVGDQPPAAGPLTGAPTLLRTTSADFRRDPKLAEECFGPSAIVVACESVDDLLGALELVQGSLTGTLWTNPADANAPRALAALAARAGRVVVNGVPTGVEVCPAMVHGGPFPACNRPDTTAVGAFAIRRWCRPVCWQNTPDALLPEELRETNPCRIFRVVNGKRIES